ncbi:hypothetical protein VNO77_27777 [Canavalia gladiata]|uniref:Uncharacterized protein n=1 Tax=Canavalia gladiata TaxID=3824 RepID=A0AAN9KXI3_CANGL
MPGASKGYADRGEAEDLCPKTQNYWQQVHGILAKEYPDVDSESLALVVPFSCPSPCDSGGSSLSPFSSMRL